MMRGFSVKGSFKAFAFFQYSVGCRIRPSIIAVTTPRPIFWLGFSSCDIAAVPQLSNDNSNLEFKFAVGGLLTKDALFVTVAYKICYKKLIYTVCDVISVV
jgi:hypothetical protein